MTCPSRPTPSAPYWDGAQHNIHYTLNQHPGFFNRSPIDPAMWPSLATIKNNARTFLLAESSTYVAYADGTYLVYPHPSRRDDYKNGDGMNLVFFDGHGEYFRGRLLKLGGSDYSKANYNLPPEESFPWY